MEARNIAFYKFVPLPKPHGLCDEILSKSQALNLLGTVLLAEEGINGMLAGSPEKAIEFESWLKKYEVFNDLKFKVTLSKNIPFKKLKVRVKSEILTLGFDEIRPQFEKVPYISSQELRQALDNKDDITLIDIRNHFEYEYGHFENAEDPNTKSFKEFATYAQNLSLDKKKKIVTYCTGGIRCEKGSLLLKKAGFENVYQLDGGILDYLAQFPDGRHFEGRCFVFDEREVLS
jgi:UPF0176 protein